MTSLFSYLSLAVVFVFAISSTPALAAKCNVSLKNTDRFDALSGVLSCLQGRIDNLEVQVERSKATQLVTPSSTLLKIDGCLAAMPGDTKTVSFVVEQDKQTNICWADGEIFLEFSDVRAGELRFRIPGTNSRWLYYNKPMSSKEYPDARIMLLAKKLMPLDGNRRAKVTIKLSKKR